jgi:putative transposase
VTQRGNHQQDVFFCDTDRMMYMALLRDHAHKAGLRVLAYCLMMNHVHIVAVPEHPDSLARGLGRVHNDYSRWLQIRQRRTGHLWQNRFFSCALDEAHLAQTLRYVELNPVRAKLVPDACDWEWSSARARIGGADAKRVIADADLGPHVGADWKRVLEQGWKSTEFELRLREATRAGRPIGDETFLCGAEQQVGHSLRPLKRGRKPRLCPTANGEFAFA